MGLDRNGQSSRYFNMRGGGPGIAPAMTKPLYAPKGGFYSMDALHGRCEYRPRPSSNDNRRVDRIGGGNRTTASISALRELKSVTGMARELLGNAADVAVYVIGLDNPSCVKIGRARSPTRRLAELQTGNPEQLFIHRVFWFEDNAAATRVELASHEYAAQEHYRLEGEWFDCIPYQAHKHIVSAADEFGLGYIEVTPSLDKDVANAA